jgi:hypothetical protein
MKKLVGLIALSLFIGKALMAQDLEPRSLSNVPTGFNAAILGYGHSEGNILFDPSVPIEDATGIVNTAVAGYLRSINFFGMSGKVDVVVPFIFDSYWEGMVSGQPRNTTRVGFADPAFRLSVNFIGAPAVKMSEFKEYKEKTIVGASLRVLPPLGQYFNNKIINLGSNRWTIKPQLGISRRTGSWVFEGYFTVWLFTTNPDLMGATMTQKPIYTFAGHGCYLFKSGMWLAFDAGYGVGGQTTVDELPKETQKNFRLGSTLTVPLSKKYSIKLNYATGVDTRVGADFDALVVALQYKWIGKKSMQ